MLKKSKIMRSAEKIIEQSKNKFNKQAKDYDYRIYGKHARSIYDFVLKKLESLGSASILDVGFGTGNILNILAQRYNINNNDNNINHSNENNKIELSGLDLSEEMLSVAKEKLGDRADLRLGNSEHLPWNDSTFDYVLCTDSFHHYPRPEIVLQEMRRVLKPEGMLILADIRVPAFILPIVNFFMKFSRGGDVNFFSESKIKYLIESMGFKNVIIEHAGRYGYIASGKPNSEKFLKR